MDLADVEFIAYTSALAERLGRNPALLVELLGTAQGYFRELGCEPVVRPAGLVYEFYVKMWGGKELPLALAPSGVRETLVAALALLAPQYPRLLFIEEPEAHLRPSAVLEYAKLVARAVNSGKYVVVSTHSDHLIVVPNNMIALWSIRDRARELGFNKAHAIDPENIAAYLIRAEGREAVVESLKIDETGIPGSAFAEIVDRLAEARARIYDAIQRVRGSLP